MTEVVTYLFHLADCHVLVSKNAFRLLKLIISCINCRRIHGVQVQSKNCKAVFKNISLLHSYRNTGRICKSMLLESYH